MFSPPHAAKRRYATKLSASRVLGAALWVQLENSVGPRMPHGMRVRGRLAQLKSVCRACKSRTVSPTSSWLGSFSFSRATSYCTALPAVSARLPVTSLLPRRNCAGVPNTARASRSSSCQNRDKTFTATSPSLFVHIRDKGHLPDVADGASPYLRDVDAAYIAHASRH